MEKELFQQNNTLEHNSNINSGIFPIVIWKLIFGGFDSLAQFSRMRGVCRRFKKEIDKMGSVYRYLVLENYSSETKKKIEKIEKLSVRRFDWKKISKNHFDLKRNYCDDCLNLIPKDEQKFFYTCGHPMIPFVETIICKFCDKKDHPNLMSLVKKKKDK